MLPALFFGIFFLAFTKITLEEKLGCLKKNYKKDVKLWVFSDILAKERRKNIQYSRHNIVLH